MEQLDVLVGQVREAGLPVTVRIEGAPRPLPAGLDLSAYRIVQEALTNALKYAAPARAQVVVRYAPHSLELEVSDRGTATSPPGNGRVGHGLVGMRERVALYGGQLSAGREPDGGYAVRARLPVDGVSP